jgi:hypothetical protein
MQTNGGLTFVEYVDGTKEVEKKNILQVKE